MEQKNNFLHKKLPELQKSEEVQDAVDKHIRVTGEKVSNNPEARLNVYMERLEKIFLNEDEETRKRNIEMLRDKIHDAFVIKREDVPESYFELQKRVARERGQPVEEIPQNIKEQMIDVIIEDQIKSLDSWVDYLSSEDAVYPTWFKYFAFRNIVKLSQFDKELGKFKERTKATTAPFPDIYREALAQVSDLYESASRDKALFNDKDFQTFLSKKFPTQYADKIQQTLEHSQESKEQIEGQWIKYEKGNEEGAKKLFESLQSKGTGWCTAGHSTALTQIKRGDFHVFYTNDKEGNPTEPRLAIRMNGTDTIGEVRGVLPHQEVEPLLQEVLDEKLSTFGNEADKYKKKSSDMKHLTTLEKELGLQKKLSKEDILFIFESTEKIEGFGYQRDPRIQELQKKVTKENIQEAFNLDQSEVHLFFSNTIEYERKSENEKNLIIIQKKISDGTLLTPEDLYFIYGINMKIRGFDSGVKNSTDTFQYKISTIIKSRDLVKDCKVMFGENTVVADKKEDINEATTVYFTNSDNRLIQKEEDLQMFERSSRFNRLKKIIKDGGDFTKQDVIFIYKESTGTSYFFTPAERNELYEMRKFLKGSTLEKALDLKPEQIAETREDITDSTVLYTKSTDSLCDYLFGEDSNLGKITKKEVYEKKLSNEKMRNNIYRKLKNNTDLNKNEIDFVFRDKDYFKEESFEQKDELRSRVTFKNLKNVLGEDLAKAIQAMQEFTSSEDYTITFDRNKGNMYIPVLENDTNGSLFTLAIEIYDEHDLKTLTDNLTKYKYKLATKEEMSTYLSRSDLFLDTYETFVYGSGYVWARNDAWNHQGGTNTGTILSSDDKRLRNIYDFPDFHDSEQSEKLRFLVAITPIKDHEVIDHYENKEDDEKYLVEIEERLRAKK